MVVVRVLTLNDRHPGVEEEEVSGVPRREPLAARN